MKLSALSQPIPFNPISQLVQPDAPTPSDSKCHVLSGSWSKKAPMAIQIGEVTVATANGKIYAIGGSTADVVDQRLNQEYDIATDRWRKRAPLPRGMTHAAATSLNGKIYVVGAFTASGHGNAVNLVYEYDPATDTWRTLAPLKSPRGSVGVTVLNGKIHAIGGRGVDKVTVTTHEVFDPASGKWTELAPLPRARDHLAVVAAGGRIHAIGGRLDASSQNTDFNDIYNPSTNTWQAGPPLPTARSGIAGVLYQDKIFIAGGECRDKKTYPEFEALRPENQPLVSLCADARGTTWFWRSGGWQLNLLRWRRGGMRWWRKDE